MRPSSERAAFARALLFFCALLLGLSLGSRANAQIDPRREGLSNTGLCGLGNTAYPTCPKRVAVAVSGNYGYTESVGPVHGGHNRLGGVVGAGYTPFDFLSVALRLDGRLDIHPSDSRGSDLTGTGDPRIFIRGGHQLNRDWSVGGESVIWFPGNKAPSFKPKATSLDLKALGAWTPHDLPVSILAYAGFRFDQSSASAPDLRRLRPGDRVSLALSDSNAVLLALGASTRAVKKTELFGEVSLDYLVGSKAPQFSKSPLRLMLGARGFLNQNIQGEVSTTFALNGRPSIAATSPLVPIEPRFLINVGVRYGWDLSPPPPPAVATAEQTPSDEPRVDLSGASDVSGVLVDEHDAPVPDVRLVLTSAPPAEPRETITDGEGRYKFGAVPNGPATLEAIATGFDNQRWNVDVSPQLVAGEKRALVRKGNIGTLRLLTRTFTSDPISAAVMIRDARGRKVVADKTNDQGLFEFDLPPGRYVVMISAPGYQPHRREITVEQYGVAIMNVDMREQK